MVKNGLKLLCPECLKAFPRQDGLYKHFRQENNEIHQGLCMQRKDFQRFLNAYRQSVGWSIAPEALPSAPRCFETDFVIEHYKNSGNIETYASLSGTAADGEQLAHTMSMIAYELFSIFGVFLLM